MKLRRLSMPTVKDRVQICSQGGYAKNSAFISRRSAVVVPFSKSIGPRIFNKEESKFIFVLSSLLWSPQAATWIHKVSPACSSFRQGRVSDCWNHYEDAELQLEPACERLLNRSSFSPVRLEVRFRLPVVSLSVTCATQPGRDLLNEKALSIDGITGNAEVLVMVDMLSSMTIFMLNFRWHPD